MLNTLPKLVRHIPHVTITAHSRPCRAGYRPAVTVFKDGKIYRSIYGLPQPTKYEAEITAECAAQAARKAATRARHREITRRIEAVGLPVVAFLGALACLVIWAECT